MNRKIFKIISISVIAFLCFFPALTAAKAAAVATNVTVPATNGGADGNFTNPKILLQPGDSVLIEALGGTVDFQANAHTAACPYSVAPDGLDQNLFRDLNNAFLCYSYDVLDYPPTLPDPLMNLGHAGLFLPAQPGTAIQPVGNGSKTFIFTGAAPQYLKLGVNDYKWQNNSGQFLARVTITRKTVGFSATDFSVDEAAGSAAITVTRSDSTAAMSVNYATSNGTAAAGQDYTAASGTLNFAAGEATKSFNVQIVNDTTVEANETVNLALSAPTGGFTLGPAATSVLTINDNDTTGNNSAFVSQNVPAQMYAGETYDVMVAFRNTGSTTWSAGTYGLSSQNPIDNATWGFNRVNLTSPIAPGATAFAAFTVTAPAAPGIYNFQWRTWQLGVAHFGALSPNVAVEVLAKPTASITDAVVTEGDSGTKQMTFVISLSEPMIDLGFVDVTTADGTALAGQDYTAYSPRVEFNEGQNSITVNVSIIGDTGFEPNEYFYLNLTGASHITIADNQAIGRILDNEKQKIADADRDGKSDFWLFRPSNGTWYGLSSRNGYSFFAVQFGLLGDVPAGGDYDGDGYPDYAVWRPANGVWYVYRTSDGQYQAYQFGLSTDIPVQGDFDGDRRTDYAVFRPATGTWYIRYSSTGTFDVEQFGTNGDVPVKGDFDGDGRADLAVFRPATGVWYVKKSADGQYIINQFGVASDKVVPADYDGDGKTDIAVWRPSTGVWYYLKSSQANNGFGAFQFGLNADVPAPGDFDGDGIDDYAVFRPSDGKWYVWRSATATMSVTPFGLSGDVPVENRWIQ